MPDQQQPPDEQPTSPDVAADAVQPEEQTLPLTQPSAPVATAPQAPPPATPRKTYQATRGVIGGAAAAVLLVGGLAGYAIGATVVANDEPDRGRGGMQWHREFSGPGGGMPGQGPRGDWDGGNGFGPGDGQWSGPPDGAPQPDQTQPEESQPDEGQGDGDSGSGT